MTLNTKLPLNKRMAFFDSDCLELATAESCRSKVLPDFGIRKRMQPLTDKLEQLYDFAKRNNIIMVFSHCCSANPVKPFEHPEVLVVPMDEKASAWQDEITKYRLINIEKRHDGKLNESFICRYFDAFQHNRNAGKLLKLINIPKWVVFGHGFDLCVDSAAKGIMAAGYHVHIVSDVTASSATGYGPYGTEESKKSILGYLLKIGATAGTAAELLGEYDGKNK